MSNLGLYQTMVTLAKRVGGPAKFMALLVGGGAVAGGTVVKGVDLAKNAISAKREADARKIQSLRTYVVRSDGTSNEGLAFQAGDEFKVLERDGDAVLIERIGDEGNPYFVSAGFLGEISDYEA